jgi:hypothetical protein
MNPTVESIATSYVEAAEGDARKALRMAITDALGDLVEAERRTSRAERLVSHGYVRGEFAPVDPSARTLPARASQRLDKTR